MERYFEQFKTYLLTEKRVSINTVQSYCTDIRQFLDFATDRLIGSQVQLADLKAYLASLKNTDLASRSMARKVSSLKAFFGYLHRFHGIDNVAESLMFPKLEKRLPKCLSEDDIQALLQVAAQDLSKTGQRNRIMLFLLYVSGMRISELIHLRTIDIHDDTHLIAVHGKGGKGRMIPVGQEIITLLSDYIKANRIRFKTDGHNPEYEYLFPVHYAGHIKPMTRQACWSLIKKIWSKTGIQKPISPHMLRHSLATHMLKHGADLRSLQMLLGHENLSTVQIYTHLDTSYLRTIYDAKHPRS